MSMSRALWKRREMVEAVMIWNEPNNLSHWNFHLDPDWSRFAAMTSEATSAIRSLNPTLPIVLGGVSSCDSDFLRLMRRYGVTDPLDAVAVHGFPLDWNHWSVDDWAERLTEAEEVSGKPVWVSEVGASSFGAEEVQRFGLERMLEQLRGRVERIHWYSLFDLPPTWPAETRHREAEGSSYYRHYYLGLLRHDGTPKLAEASFPRDGSVGLCQWFHFEDHRLERAASWMKNNGVVYIRTGISWADSYRPGAVDWFDRQMEILAPFKTTITLCFTPQHLGLEPHHTSPPGRCEDFAAFAAWVVDRYAPSGITKNSFSNENSEVLQLL